MVENGKRHWALDLLTKGMEAVGPRAPVWFFRMLLSIPFAGADHWKFIKFCNDEFDTRAKDKNAGAGIHPPVPLHPLM